MSTKTSSSEPNLTKTFHPAHQSKNQLKGSKKNDTLVGTQADEKLLGHKGNDLIYAGEGADTLVGGKGKDTFGIGEQAGNTTLAQADWIADFCKGQDVIQLLDNLTLDQLNIFQGTSIYRHHTIIQNRNTGQYLAILKNVKSNSLKQTDFIEPPASSENQSPQAGNDTLSDSVLLSSRLEIPVADLLVNDSDTDGDTLTITAVSSDDGTVSLNDGIITFQANPNFAGPATFEYTLSDGKGGEDTATVSFNVVSEVDLGTLSPQTDLPVGVSGFTINAALQSVSNAGDVNGDGLADFIVKAVGVNTSYVVFGKTDITPVDLTEIASGNDGFAINGAGGVVSGTGDVNNDGFTDVIVNNNVIFGKADGAAVEVNDIAAGMGGGFTITSSDLGSPFGFTVGGGGDVNQDGLADLIIGIPAASPNGLNRAGESYVIFGKTSSTAIDLAEVAAGNGGFIIKGRDAEDFSGGAVSDAGDVNGDGFADVIIGASLAAGGGGAFDGGGEAYVVFGKADGDPVELADVVNGDGGFVINGSDTDDNYRGISVSKAGDINGDGLTDLAVGFYGANGFPGEVYVVFGKTDGMAVNPSDLAAGNGSFRIRGFVAFDYYGIDVSTAGDMNGDGFDDLIVSNPYAETDMYSNPEVHIGKSYVLFGKTGTTEVSVSDLAAGKGGFMLTGADPLEQAGRSVSGGGDINGDGFTDIIIGAPETKYVLEGNELESYVVFGGDFTASITEQGTNGDDLLTGTPNADVMIGGQGDDELIGNGGVDVLYGGAGDDILAIKDTNFKRLDGGTGIDTIRLDSSANLDLTAIHDPLIQGIEQIDLNQSFDNVLTLNFSDLLNLSDTSNTLTVMGGMSDQLNANLIGADFINNGIINGFREYSNGIATLRVMEIITQNVSV